MTERFAVTLQDMGLKAHAPLYEEVYDLAANKMLAEGIVLETKKTTGPATAPASPAYQRLQDVSRDLERLVSASRGRPNKDLARLADQLRQIMDKWQ